MVVGALDSAALYRELTACRSVGELFASAAALGCATCGFERGVVLDKEGHRLTATTSDALSHGASDRLRREVLRRPIPGLAYIARNLQLDHAAIAMVTIDAEPLAVLVLDRSGRQVDPQDHAAVDTFAAIVAVALELVVLRERMAQAARQLRHITRFAEAINAELLTAPVEIGRRGHLLELPVGPPSDSSTASHRRLRELFTEREAEIAQLLVEGRSNRDIAQQLFVSPETVKMHVAHILRKLDVKNRVEAATRLLSLITPARVDDDTRLGIAGHSIQGDSRSHG